MTRPARGPNVRRRIAARAVRELREAAAHGVRAAVRARGCDARELQPTASRSRRSGGSCSRSRRRGSRRWASIASSIARSTRRIRAPRGASCRAGLLGVREATLAVIVASVVFVFAAWRLNPLCAVLSPVALGWVLWYSYTKRFTHWSHIVLGVGLAIAPVGGYLAVAGTWSTPWWMLVALALGVSSWTAGFDILYALQDEEFDRAERLHSVPVVFGRRGALAIARGLHVRHDRRRSPRSATAVPVGLALRGGRVRRGGAAALRALARSRRRSVSSRCRVLHDERRHQPNVLRIRARRAAGAMTSGR